MTQEEQNVINAVVSGNSVHDAKIELLVSRVSQETKEAILGASHLAVKALEFRKMFLDKAKAESGLVDRFGSSSSYELLVALVGKNLADLY